MHNPKFMFDTSIFEYHKDTGKFCGLQYTGTITASDIKKPSELQKKNLFSIQTYFCDYM
jgi:hypothetical protein